MQGCLDLVADPNRLRETFEHEIVRPALLGEFDRRPAPVLPAAAYGRMRSTSVLPLAGDSAGAAP